jgi:tight adherence protein C
MLGFIYLVIILGIACIIWGAFGHTFKSARFKLPAEAQAARRLKLQAYIAQSASFSQGILEKIKLHDRIKNQLDSSHVRLKPAEFFNLKLLIMAVLAVLAYFVVGKNSLVGAAIGAALGYILPDLWLKKRITQRKYQIARLLPETVDLLGLCVEAGLDFTTAVKWIIDKVPANPMIEEMVFLLEEIKWGKARSQALKDMSKRLNIPEVTSFVQALVQAERMGTPVAEAFTIISEDTRLQRFHRGERFAMQAPIKILLPLIFCILPVIAIIIGGPIFLEFMQGGLLKGIGG